MSNTRKLHIGGQEAKEGWEILDASPSDIVDHTCDAKNLDKFNDNTFDVIYASHILEHFDYLKTGPVLSEWKRILKPNGSLYISVPDLIKLSTLLLSTDLTIEEQFHVSRMFFGGHINSLDYHQAGFTAGILASRLLNDAKFARVEVLEELPYGFNDCSHLKFKGVFISLNVRAVKSSE